MRIVTRSLVLFGILLLTLGVVSVLPLSHAQSSATSSPKITLNSSVSPITVTTDKKTYSDGDSITISGSTRDYIEGVPVTVMVRNPIGNVVMIAQVPLGSDKKYSTTLTAGGALWKSAGTYEVDVSFGDVDRSATTTFQFSGSKIISSPNTFPVEGTNSTVPYSITNGKVLGMKIDPQSKSLLVAVQTTDDGSLTVTLPRSLIDAKAGNQDDQYYVLLDGQEAQFDETSTTSTDRTLSIPFYYGTEEIEILGTQVVPEFGTIAPIMLALAIILIITLSFKTNLRLISKN